MKRALAIAVAVCTLGFAGFSQIAIKGSWTATWCAIGTPLLSSTLDLTYTVAGFDITSKSVFGATGLTDQSFSLKGVFGPFEVTGGMTFIPTTLKIKDFTAPGNTDYTITGPAYRSANLTTKFDFGGVTITGTVNHTNMWVGFVTYDVFLKNQTCIYPAIWTSYTYWTGASSILVYNGTTLLGAVVGNFILTSIGAFDGTAYAVTPSTADVTYITGLFPTADNYKALPSAIRLYVIVPSYMSYSFGGSLGDLSVSVGLVDYCTGIQFDNAVITLKNVELCCGIKLGAELKFSKCLGFEYLSFSGINIGLCCGVSLDVGVKFSVDAKEVTLTPRFTGFGDACFTVWGNPLFSGTSWTGIEIYGYRIRCTIADCNYLEIVHGWNVTEVNKKLATADRFLAACGEFELWKLGFCGAGCCGGKYEVALRIFFGSLGGLFDLTRMVYSVKIPVMANFTLNLDGTVAAAACTSTSFCLGWTFTF